jgi:hypothetical protein
MPLKPRLVFVAFASVISCVAFACSGDDASSVPLAPDIREYEVCDLVREDQAAQALGVDSTASGWASNGLAVCTWEFMRNGASAFVALEVVRGRDVPERNAKEAFDYTSDLKSRALDDVTRTRIHDVGDEALFIESTTTRLLVVRGGPRVFVLYGEALSEESALRIARRAIESLEALAPAPISEE